MKICTKCGVEKGLDEFYETSRVGRDGKPYRLPSCKQCYADYYAANRERQKETSNRARIKARYGLTVEQYDELIARGCGICGAGDGVRIVMDHCHASGEVREALCDGCNLMLGAAKDRPAVLRAAADYLERHAPA